MPALCRWFVSVTASSLVLAIALVIGAATGVFIDLSVAALLCVIPPMAVASAILWCRQRLGLSFAGINIVCVACGAALAADARADALHPSIRLLLDRHISGFAIDTPGPPAPHDPIATRVRLTADAAPADDVTTLRARILGVRIAGQWHTVNGGLFISVGGTAARRQGTEWTAGRTLEMPVTFRRPARFLNDGVPDFERDLALDGTTLFASTKSGLLVDVRDHNRYPVAVIERLACRSPTFHSALPTGR